MHFQILGTMKHVNASNSQFQKPKLFTIKSRFCGTQSLFLLLFTNEILALTQVCNACNFILCSSSPLPPKKSYFCCILCFKLLHIISITLDNYKLIKCTRNWSKIFCCNINNVSNCVIINGKLENFYRFLIFLGGLCVNDLFLFLIDLVKL